MAGFHNLDEFYAVNSSCNYINQVFGNLSLWLCSWFSFYFVLYLFCFCFSLFVGLFVSFFRARLKIEMYLTSSSYISMG